MDREKFERELEEMGELEVRRRVFVGYWSKLAPMQRAAEFWVKQKDDERELAAADKRESRSRRTLQIATAAMIIAAIGAYDKIVSMISEIIEILRAIKP